MIFHFHDKSVEVLNKASKSTCR